MMTLLSAQTERRTQQLGYKNCDADHTTKDTKTNVNKNSDDEIDDQKQKVIHIFNNSQHAHAHVSLQESFLFFVLFLHCILVSLIFKSCHKCHHRSFFNNLFVTLQ